jgi:hypothetical protein
MTTWGGHLQKFLPGDLVKTVHGLAIVVHIGDHSYKLFRFPTCGAMAASAWCKAFDLRLIKRGPAHVARDRWFKANVKKPKGKK